MDRIAVGGMAELYRAKITGVQGFEKLIAIKRILPHLTVDENLVSSFIDEAKLAALLHHQNIVQIYNFGIMEDSYFIAMEFLFGKDLRLVMQKSRQKGMHLSLDHALYIASRICAGLDHAHNLKDFHGNSLNIIHRDIGPHNIFLTYDGQVKIIDFGIAKAANQSSMTQAGSIKGKIAYMSPEQALGKSIDHRADIFSIGIVLYEMVTYRQMFAGDTFEAYARVREAQFEPPEKVREDLPAAVCRILKKALAKEPSKRYQSAEAMLSDIEQCMSKRSFKPSDRTLSRYMRDLFEEEAQGEDRAMREEVLMDSGESPEVKEDADTSRITMNKDTVPAKRRSRSNFITILVLVLIASALFAAVTYTLTPFPLMHRVKAVLASRSQGLDTRDSGASGTMQEGEKGVVPNGESPSGPPSPESVFPGPEVPILEEAQGLLASGRFEEAIALFEVFLENNPSMAEKIIEPYAMALQGYASHLMDTDQKGAKSLLLESIMLYPEGAQGHYLLGRLYAEENNVPGAIASYRKAIDLDPDMAQAFFNLGYLYAVNKDYAGAEEMYERVIALSPPFMDEALFNLAFVQARIGKVRESIENLEAALGINPGNEQAKRLLHQLKQRSG